MSGVKIAGVIGTVVTTGARIDVIVGTIAEMLDERTAATIAVSKFKRQLSFQNAGLRAGVLHSRLTILPAWNR